MSSAHAMIQPTSAACVLRVQPTFGEDKANFQPVMFRAGSCGARCGGSLVPLGWPSPLEMYKIKA